MIALPENFRMTRGWYWAFVLTVLASSFLYGVVYALITGIYEFTPEHERAVTVFSSVALGTIGYQRLKAAGVKHPSWGIGAAVVIGTIWVGCISDRPLTLELEETST